MNKIICFIFFCSTYLLPLGCLTTSIANSNKQASLENNQQDESFRPSSALAYQHYLRALLHEENGHIRKSILELRQALIYDYSSAFMHTKLGALYSYEGLWQLAREEAQKALVIDPEYVPGLLLLGKTLFQRGNRQNAIEAYQKVIALDKKNISIDQQITLENQQYQLCPSACCLTLNCL